ncbi:MAG TPA: GNAT family N-acetyltransferase [Thermoanaerobaculia bacterium]|nr:GNAT family N-acetyltransferase [Thermoanaerobaculia bacterium]
MTRPGSGPTLVTERLRLVPCSDEQVDRLHEMLTEGGVRRYLLDDRIVERSWVVDVVESSRRTFADAGFGLWCVLTRGDDELAGLAGLRSFPGAREPQLLYVLHPAFWGRGLAAEASRAVTEYAFEELGFEELLASTDSPNLASIRVMERIGMRFLEAGRMSGHALVLYRISRSDWMRRRAAASAATGKTPAGEDRAPVSRAAREV